jgi:LacI family transcriptional regulator
MIRLKDIAARAGLSLMTVSKALRDKPDLAPATKDRVRAIAEEMGYVPNASASSLRCRTSRLLGLVVPASTDPVVASIILAIEQAAAEIGYEIIFAQTLGKIDKEEAALRRLLTRRVDGLFLSPVYRLEKQSRVYAGLHSQKLPTIILGHRAPFCAAFSAVHADDIAASETATRHLLDLGHRRIAFLAGPQMAPWAHERLDGYRRAHRSAGIPLDDKLVFTAGATVEDGTTAALQFIQERPGATAIQAVNDLVAIGAAETFLSQGLRIPEDISVVGYGDILASEHFRTPLTTIRLPKNQIGNLAMELMQKALRGEPATVRRIPTEFVIRKSSGPPAAAGSRRIETA